MRNPIGLQVLAASLLIAVSGILPGCGSSSSSAPQPMPKGRTPMQPEKTQLDQKKPNPSNARPKN